MSLTLVIIIGLALSFSFMNGVHDSRNVVATMISSRAYPTRIALGVTALAEFFGPFIFGVAVAQTIGRGIVESSAVTEQVLVVALGSALIWNLLTWVAKLPSSSSHALIGGLLGAATMRAGPSVIQTDGLLNILISLFASPIIGFFAGFIFLRFVIHLSRNATPRVNDFFRRSQLLTALILGLSHGSNDGQKSMGLITLALVTAGSLSTFVVPTWVIALCALSLALGTAVGGWRLTHTVGGISFYKIRPVDGFSSQATSALVILIASLVGGPVSATQVINSSIMGIGTAERANKVRWGLARDIIIAWILTIPATTFLSAGLYLLTSRFLF